VGAAATTCAGEVPAPSSVPRLGTS